ncbi:MAG: EAL domain-containing protein [Deltaproteobacteria bacterium]|nr:EAL domain-containing protein [Deltaproteobacteria bacterium]
MDGFEVCRTLRADPRTAAIPILMMTALDDEDSIESAFAVGATDFVTKPITLSLLPHRLRYLMRAAAAFRKTRLSSARLAHAQRLAKLAQWEMDLGTSRLTFAEGAERVLGDLVTSSNGSLGELVARVHPDDQPRLSKAMRTFGAHQVEFRMVDNDGMERVFHQEAEMVCEAGGLPYLLGATLDITRLKDAEDRVEQLANQDASTGLPNRHALDRAAEQLIAKATDGSPSAAVLFIGLDQLRIASDSGGQAASDRLLTAAAKVLEESGDRRPVLVARTGTRELGVLLADLNGPADAAAYARAVLSTLERSPVRGENVTLTGARIGIALFPNDARSSGLLVDRAATAMHHVRAAEQSAFRFFTEEIQADVERRLTIEAGLRRALGGGPGLALFYQPKVQLPSERAVGVEALLRWTANTPERVTPPEVIQVAEAAGLDIALGEWVLSTACAQAKAWLAAGVDGVQMAVNVTASQFRSPGFVDRVRQVLAQSALPPELLQLEITEGTLMDDAEEAIAALAALRGLGAKIALDDFGTGYSSLAYLTRLPVDTLKIDRSFVIGIGSKRESATVASAIVSLSQSLGLDVVAEGVETEEQRRFFQAQGEVTIQGWLFAKAMPSAEATRWLVDRQQRYALAG